MAGGGVVGKPYPRALRLYSIAADNWPLIDAHYASVDLIRFPPHRFLNCVYAWCVDRINPDKLEEWLFMLDSPLPGREKEVSAVQAADEGESFMALMAQVKT